MPLPQYTFAISYALGTGKSKEYKETQIILLDKTYTKDGLRQGRKMFSDGPFGMKSVIRQSAFDAYKNIFQEIRNDLIRFLHPLGDPRIAPRTYIGHSKVLSGSKRYLCIDRRPPKKENEYSAVKNPSFVF